LQPPLILSDGTQTMEDFRPRPPTSPLANLLAAQCRGDRRGVQRRLRVETSARRVGQHADRGDVGQPTWSNVPARKVNNVVRRLADTSAAANAIGFVAAIGCTVTTSPTCSNGGGGSGRDPVIRA